MSKKLQDVVEEKYPVFANSMKDMKTKDELEAALIIYLRQKEDLIVKKSRDEMLNGLKERKAELSKPYNQVISALKKMQNCIYKFGHKFDGSLKEEFDKNLVGYARQLADVKRRKEADKDLVAVSEEIAEINEDYNPSIKQLEMKSDYISWLLKERFDSNAPEVEY